MSSREGKLTVELLELCFEKLPLIQSFDVQVRGGVPSAWRGPKRLLPLKQGMGSAAWVRSCVPRGLQTSPNPPSRARTPGLPIPTPHPSLPLAREP